MATEGKIRTNKRSKVCNNNSEQMVDTRVGHNAEGSAKTTRNVYRGYMSKQREQRTRHGGCREGLTGKNLRGNGRPITPVQWMGLDEVLTEGTTGILESTQAITRGG